eukprot:762349-Pleurochrysis_carterae.AAC.1
MSARKSRTRAAVLAAELKEANAVDAVTWLAGLQAVAPDGQTGLPLLSFATWPQLRQLWHRTSPFSEAGSPDALNMAKSVASSSF